MDTFIKYIVIFLLAFSAEISASAQVNDSLPGNSDSTAIYLNRKEDLRCIRAQVVTLGADQLGSGYSLNMLSALQGKINGVDIKTGTGANSSSSAFFMRGERNLFGSNQPLYVVDGLPIIGQLNSHIGIDPGNPVNDWNLDDIESIIILKGAQAASLYGYKAGNGAVIIKTKNAGGKGFHIDYNSSVLKKNIADYPDFQNKYGQGIDGQYSYSNGIGGGINDDIDMNWGPPLNGQLITQVDGNATGWINGQAQQVRGGDIWARNQAEIQGLDNSIKPTPWIAQPDNVHHYFQPAWTFANNLGLSFADRQGGIRISYTNVSADDVTPHTRYIKNTLGGNFSYSFFKKLTLFGSLQYTSLKDKNVFIPGDDDNNPMRYFAWMGRQVNTNSLKQYWQADQENLQPYNYEGQYWNNPWFVARENATPLERKNAFGTYGIKFAVAKGLSVNYLGGFNKIDARNERHTSSVGINNYGVETLNYETETYRTSRHSFFTDYTFRPTKKHYFSSFAGLYIEKYAGHEQYKQSLFIESSSGITSSGIYGGISYTGNNAYSVRLTLNKDKLSYLGLVKVNTPLFYAASAEVKLNKVLNLPQLISQLSIESGYAKTSLNVMDVLEALGWGLEESSSPTLAEYTLSADLGILQNRITCGGDYYHTLTSNGQMIIAMSGNSGYSYRSIYTASVENVGFEFNLMLVPFQSKKFTWKSSVSYFKNKNKVIELTKGIARISQYSQGISLGCEPGESTGNLYGTKFERFQGQVVYKNGIPQPAMQETSLGNVNPDYVIIFNNSLSIRKFTITWNLEYSKGGTAYSRFYAAGTYAGTLAHTADREHGLVGEGVKWDEASNTYVKNDVNVSAQSYYTSISLIDEYAIMDASYLKIKEVMIAYPFRLNHKTTMTCSFFGQNIFTLAKNKHYNQGNLNVYDNMFFRGINSYNLPESNVMGMKIQVHI